VAQRDNRTRTGIPELEAKLRQLGPVTRWLCRRFARGALFHATLLAQGSGLAMELIYRNRPEGTTNFGWVVDAVMLNMHDVVGTRDRFVATRTVIARLVERRIAERGEATVVSCPSGTGRDVMEAAAACSKPEAVRVHLLDIDELALDYARELASEIGVPHVATHRADIWKLPGRFAGLGDVVVSQGFVDYFEDPAEAEKLYRDHLGPLVAPGGVMVTSFALRIISRIFRKAILDWVFCPRNETEIRDILSRAGFVARTPRGVKFSTQKVLVCRRIEDAAGSANV
jgi:SAM-dependent methyltransferase